MQVAQAARKTAALQKAAEEENRASHLILSILRGLLQMRFILQIIKCILGRQASESKGKSKGKAKAKASARADDEQKAAADVEPAEGEKGNSGPTWAKCAFLMH